MKKCAALLLLLTLPEMVFGADINGNWQLEKSNISYLVTHPLHHVVGKTDQSRGKGTCSAGHGQFLVGVPVKSFDSGDGNRDTHMLQITKGADHPLVVVHIDFKVPVKNGVLGSFLADLSIEFAGKTVKYPQVPLKMVPLEGSQFQVTTLIPVSLKDFGIAPPSLLGVPINDSVPVQVDTTWKKVASFDTK
jgi:hypothetical protein